MPLAEFSAGKFSNRTSPDKSTAALSPVLINTLKHVSHMDDDDYVEMMET